MFQQIHDPGAAPLSQSLLVALCRRDAAKDPETLDAAALGDAGFRREFLELAASHRVLGLTLSVITRALAERGHAAENVPYDELLRNLRRSATVFEIRRDQVVAALLNQGVRPVILKGAAIAITFYDAPWQRDLADLDILVRSDRLEQTLQLLISQGYRGPTPEKCQVYRDHHFHIPVRYADVHIVEIHWGLTLPGAPFQLAAGELLARSTPLERQGQPVLFLPRPEHTLLHLVVQNLQEGFSRLARLVDMDRILAATPEFDWELLLAAAREGNLTSATAESLQLAHRLLGATIPPAVARRLRPGPVTRFHLSILRPDRFLLSRRSTSVRSAKDLLDLWLLGGFRKRLRLLRQMLSSDPAVVFPPKKRPAALLRLWKLGKLVFFQLYLYGTATLDRVTPSRIGQARFR